MIQSEHKDLDGFKLQFEESCADEERRYYMKTYPRVDAVAKDRVHCTTCDLHVGTAPISEKIIRTHQILNVTQCNKCFAFYNSGDFGKGDDGSEYYCRWCGQGGEVFCCSTCPFVFCVKCIRSNLESSYIKEIESNDDWSCFVCNKDILKRLRASHWALRNFMNKQLEKIQNVNINSEDELNNMLNDDSAICCPRKKRKQVLKPSPAPIKRPSMNGGSIIGQPPAKKQIIAPTKPLKVPINSNYHLTKPGPKPQQPGQVRRNNDEVVCTPDIMGLFKDKNRPSTSIAPPPLILRQNQTRPIRPVGPGQGVNPIYHNVNGFQIDLNQAARQEIFRLPNGKLIQVRKQTNSQQQQSAPRMMPPIHMGPRTQFTIRPNHSMTTQSRMVRPSMTPQLRVRGPAPQRPTQPAPSSTQTSGNASTIFTQQNGSISVARAPQPDTPFGKSKTAFEDKIISGLEICQHTINKMITLTNSSSFKTSRNFSDLKELYIHLQYLFTYTSGKIKTLQDGLITGMEELAKKDTALKEKNGDEDGELEIVEQKQEVIEVLSDDEVDDTPRPASLKNKGPQPSTSAAAAAAAAAVSEAAQEAAQENNSIQQEIMANLFDTMQNSISRFVPQTDHLLESFESDDRKLKMKQLVKVERLENSKNPIIKQYMIAIQQRRDDRSESRESSPMDFPFMPEVVMDESGADSEAATNECMLSETPETAAADTSEKEPETSEKEPETSDVVEIPSDEDGDSNGSDKDKEKSEDKEEEVLENEVQIREEVDDGDSSSVIAISSQETMSATETAEVPAETRVDDDVAAPPPSEDAADVSMLSAEDISKITENGIDDEKDLLDNLINSLEETEPLASIELENFP